MYAQLIGFTINNDNPEEVLNNAIKLVKLNEKHEVGEIIEDYWLIISDPEIIVADEPYEPKYFYEKGDYVRVADIRFYKQFSTDKDYNDRKDMRWLQTKANDKMVKVYRYEYIGQGNEMNNELNNLITNDMFRAIQIAINSLQYNPELSDIVKQSVEFRLCVLKDCLGDLTAE